MAFICLDCWNARAERPPVFAPRSLGPCEYCGIEKACYDVPTRAIPVKPLEFILLDGQVLAPGEGGTERVIGRVHLRAKRLLLIPNLPAASVLSEVWAAVPAEGAQRFDCASEQEAVLRVAQVWLIAQQARQARAADAQP